MMSSAAPGRRRAMSDPVLDNFMACPPYLTSSSGHRGYAYISLPRNPGAPSAVSSGREKQECMEESPQLSGCCASTFPSLKYNPPEEVKSSPLGNICITNLSRGVWPECGYCAGLINPPPLPAPVSSPVGDVSTGLGCTCISRMARNTRERGTVSSRRPSFNAPYRNRVVPPRTGGRGTGRSSTEFPLPARPAPHLCARS